MSVLKEIKGIILRGLKSETVEVKEAVLEVFDAIDSDLDSVDYDPANSDDDSAKDVIEAVAGLNRILIGLGEEEDSSEITTIGDISEKDLRNEDDETK